MVGRVLGRVRKSTTSGHYQWPLSHCARPTRFAFEARAVWWGTTMELRRVRAHKVSTSLERPGEGSFFQRDRWYAYGCLRRSCSWPKMGNSTNTKFAVRVYLDDQTTTVTVSIVSSQLSF